MITQLHTDITVAQICNGFVYDALEEKGLYGLSGNLVIQPEYQRNYIYASGNRDKKVIHSLINKYPLGVIYFNKRPDDKYEILDGQQRITSIGRFVTGKFPIQDGNGLEHYFSGLNAETRNTILNSTLLIYICEGEETEIKEWFQTVNIAGMPLNSQELLNAIYSGPFLTKAKEVFSNSNNASIQKWKAYIAGDAKRQDYLATALSWIAARNNVRIDDYMSQHRNDTNIDELKRYFDSVIEWSNVTFSGTDSNMVGLEWNRLYEEYHSNSYNPQELWKRTREFLADPCVTCNKGVFEYVLGREADSSLLNVRFFDNRIKTMTYERQTEEAQSSGVSNCPTCALCSNSNRTKIWKLSEMDADHVTAWHNGGTTDSENCQMLCRTHNRAKGNK